MKFQKEKKIPFVLPGQSLSIQKIFGTSICMNKYLWTKRVAICYFYKLLYEQLFVNKSSCWAAVCYYCKLSYEHRANICYILIIYVWLNIWEQKQLQILYKTSKWNFRMNNIFEQKQLLYVITANFRMNKYLWTKQFL